MNIHDRINEQEGKQNRGGASGPGSARVSLGHPLRPGPHELLVRPSFRENVQELAPPRIAPPRDPLLSQAADLTPSPSITSLL